MQGSGVAPPSVSVNATAMLGFTAAEEEEVEDDPLADEDDDIEDDNHEQDAVNNAHALPLLSQRNVSPGAASCRLYITGKYN